MMRLVRGLILFVCVLGAGVAWLARTEPRAQAVFVAIEAILGRDAEPRPDARPASDGLWSSAPGGGSPFADFGDRPAASDGPRDFTNRGRGSAPSFTSLP